MSERLPFSIDLCGVAFEVHARTTDAQEYLAGIYYNATETVFPPVYTPDTSRPASRICVPKCCR